MNGTIVREPIEQTCVTCADGMVWRVDAVGLFLRTSGCLADDDKTVYVTYAELSYTVYCAAATFYALTTAGADAGVSVRLFAFLCLQIESVIVLCIAFRLYHRRQFRDMHRHSVGRPASARCRSQMAAVTAYHAIASNVFIAIPAAYAAASDAADAGDPFTFPYPDVLPVPTVGLPVYACKYAAYAVTVYIAHVEMCFINTTFMHYVGVLQCDVRVVADTVRRALADNDARTLREAVARHRRLLKYFETMKLVFGKPILLKLSFQCIYFSFTASFVIQTVQGHINGVILSICIASSVAGVLSVIIYCVYGSATSDLHDEILRAFYDCTLLNASKSFKKASLIMMTRAVIPLDFTVGYVFTINSNLLVKLAKFSFTVLNVLLACMKSMNFGEDVKG